MRVLLLDIDGVVNKKENFNRSKYKTPYPVDSYCAFLVAKIQLETNCKVVLSSSWRHFPDAVKIVNKSIVDIHDVTPTKGGFRGDEIKEWLWNQSLKSNFVVDKYAILDDESDFYPDQPLFKTEFEHGLTDEIARKVVEYLNKK